MWRGLVLIVDIEVCTRRLAVFSHMTSINPGNCLWQKADIGPRGGLQRIKNSRQPTVFKDKNLTDTLGYELADQSVSF